MGSLCITRVSQQGVHSMAFIRPALLPHHIMTLVFLGRFGWSPTLPRISVETFSHLFPLAVLPGQFVKRSKEDGPTTVRVLRTRWACAKARQDRVWPWIVFKADSSCRIATDRARLSSGRRARTGSVEEAPAERPGSESRSGRASEQRLASDGMDAAKELTQQEDGCECIEARVQLCSSVAVRQAKAH
jgi:hypothetical protein